MWLASTKTDFMSRTLRSEHSWTWWMQLTLCGSMTRTDSMAKKAAYTKAKPKQNSARWECSVGPPSRRSFKIQLTNTIWNGSMIASRQFTDLTTLAPCLCALRMVLCWWPTMSRYSNAGLSILNLCWISQQTLTTQFSMRFFCGMKHPATNCRQGYSHHQAFVSRKGSRRQ